MLTRIGLAALLIVAAVVGGIIIGRRLNKPGTGSLAKLEEIKKIKELHLVKHNYQDISFIHRKSDPSKAVRAILVMPVSVTGYIDLEQIEVVHNEDSIERIILPDPILGDPNFYVDKMEIRSVRDFQIHIGRDLYSEVLEYFKKLAVSRKDSIRKLSISNGLLTETRNESRKYVLSLLNGLRLGFVRLEFRSGAARDSVTTVRIVPELIPAANIQ